MHPQTGERFLEFDGIRGVALLLVLIHHCGRDAPVAGPADRVVQIVADCGWIGVDLFFLLSGYLITGILLDARMSLRTVGVFYARRALRIFPAYYALLFGLFVLAPALGISLVGESVSDSAWFWAYGANFLIALRDWPHRVLIPLWSLAVEEHFYLIWPLLVLAIRVQWLAAATITVALTSLCARAIGLSLGWTPAAIYVLTLTRLDSLAIGSFLAAVRRASGRPLVWTLRLAPFALLFTLVAAGVVAGAGYGHWGRWSESGLVFGLFLLAVGLGAALTRLIFLAETHPVRRLLRQPALVLVGQRSYGMYLYQMPVLEVVSRVGLDLKSRVPPGQSSWPYVVANIALQGLILFGVAQLSFRILEGPMLRLKDRLPYPAPGAGNRFQNESSA